LIYKVRLSDGSFTVVHINRLKRAYGHKLGSEIVFVKKHTRNIPQKECNSFIDKNKLDMETPSREQVIESGNGSMSETEGVTTTEPS